VGGLCRPCTLPAPPTLPAAQLAHAGYRQRGVHVCRGCACGCGAGGRGVMGECVVGAFLCRSEGDRHPPLAEPAATLCLPLSTLCTGRYGPYRGGLDRVRKGALISVAGKQQPLRPHASSAPLTMSCSPSSRARRSARGVQLVQTAASSSLLAGPQAPAHVARGCILRRRIQRALLPLSPRLRAHSAPPVPPR
jgi:hypothetical protein